MNRVFRSAFLISRSPAWVSLPAVEPHDADDLIDVGDDALDDDWRFTVLYFLKQLRQGFFSTLLLLDRRSPSCPKI